MQYAIASQVAQYNVKEQQPKEVLNLSLVMYKTRNRLNQERILPGYGERIKFPSVCKMLVLFCFGGYIEEYVMIKYEIQSPF